MAKQNVEYNGRWACYSSIADAFITPFMDEFDYEIWRKEEYGDRYTPIKKYTTIDIKEAVLNLRIYNSREFVLKNLVECGLSEAEATSLIDEIEDKYYRPKPADNGLYICPNCKKATIKKGQVQCDNETFSSFQVLLNLIIYV